MQKNALTDAREKIDQIDRELLDLIRRRMDVADEVGTYKREHHLPVLDEQREQKLLSDRRQRASALGLPDDVEELFGVLLKMSRDRQKAIVRGTERPRRAAFQGVPGANSHMALISFLGEEAESIACDRFADVFAAVSGGEADFGVVPIENSYAGSVVQVLDLLSLYDLNIVAEKSLPVDHMLAALPGASLDGIRNVYSHEQALAQCAPFLQDHPQMTAQPFYNTAGAAAFVAQSGDLSAAALCSEYAAQLYGLKILYRNANASRDNTTRFILVAPEPYVGEDANKAAIVFSLVHKPGTLAGVMSHFAAHGLNMVKIESRPLKDRKFEYRFFVDFEGADVRTKLDKAIRVDPSLFTGVRLLGAYVSQEPRPERSTL